MAVIPWGGLGANYNFKDKKRYIISAREMKKYLTESWGEPDMTLGDACNVECLQQKLKPGQVAIVGSEGHSSVVTGTYTDPYVDAYGGDVWILPTR